MSLRSRGSKRARKVSDRMAVVDEEDRAQAQQARLEALEAGLGEDALAVDDDDEEFDIQDELEVEVTAKGKLKKKKGAVKRRPKRFNGLTSTSFAVLLEESGIYEGKVNAPHYLSAEATPVELSSKRSFCSICGNFSKYKCTRCREAYCCLKCYRTHNELRCLKFGL